jgi:hypothetical protein
MTEGLLECVGGQNAARKPSIGQRSGNPSVMYRARHRPLVASDKHGTIVASDKHWTDCRERSPGVACALMCGMRAAPTPKGSVLVANARTSNESIQ